MAQAPPAGVDTEPFEYEPVNATCGFRVLIALSGRTKTITLPGDRAIVTAPGQDVTLTNVDTKQTVTLNITGATHITTRPNGDVEYVVTGRNLL